MQVGRAATSSATGVSCACDGHRLTEPYLLCRPRSAHMWRRFGAHLLTSWLSIGGVQYRASETCRLHPVSGALGRTPQGSRHMLNRTRPGGSASIHDKRAVQRVLRRFLSLHCAQSEAVRTSPYRPECEPDVVPGKPTRFARRQWLTDPMDDCHTGTVSSRAMRHPVPRVLQLKHFQPSRPEMVTPAEAFSSANGFSAPSSKSSCDASRTT